MPGFVVGGERGIRTLDTLLTYTHFPGVLLQPLGHLSRIVHFISFAHAWVARLKNGSGLSVPWRLMSTCNRKNGGF